MGQPCSLGFPCKSIGESKPFYNFRTQEQEGYHENVCLGYTQKCTVMPPTCPPVRAFGCHTCKYSFASAVCAAFTPLKWLSVTLLEMTCEGVLMNLVGTSVDNRVEVIADPEQAGFFTPSFKAFFYNNPLRWRWLFESAEEGANYYEGVSSAVCPCLGSMRG